LDFLAPIHGDVFRGRVKAMGIKEVLIAPSANRWRALRPDAFHPVAAVLGLLRARPGSVGAVR